MTRTVKVVVLGAIVLMTAALRSGTVSATGDVVRVRVSADVAACVRPSLESVAAAQDIAITFETGPVHSGRGADILVSTGHEVTRALEGGNVGETEVVELGHRGERAVVAIGISDAPDAARLLDVLRMSDGRVDIDRCLAQGSASAESRRRAQAFDVTVTGTGRYAAAIIDWWISTCSAAYNGYNDPAPVVGAPDALRFGKDDYTGIMSLGQGGYVTVDMGASVVDHAGPDFRVYQTTSLEPVTLYAADNPNGPFTLVGLQRECGTRIPHLLSGYCDFDLAEAGLKSARYLKIEDGEIYPCAAGDTITEGADIDAVEILAAS
jgi:hypothetical protein